MVPRCYFLIGPMGCGKSTWCENNPADLNDPAVISTDALYEAAAVRDGNTYADAFATYPFADMVKDARAHLIRAVIAKRDIIIDQTNCTVRDRNLFRRNIPAAYSKIGVVFDFDKEECINRVVERAKRTGKLVPIGAVVNKIKLFEPCQPGEFDEILRITRTG